MKAPAFWWQDTPTLAARLLAPGAAIVSHIASRRMARPPSQRLDIPVVCVGNPTVGGSGKTPVAIAIADALAKAGRAPVFLTRGYRGSERGPVRVEKDHRAAEVGDEPLLLAQHWPTIVSRDRAAGGALAQRHGDVVVMDDGFQNPLLAKDFSVLVVDAAVGLGNGRVTPSGPLRAPFAAHEPYADALILTTAGEPSAPVPRTTLPIHDVALRTVSPVDMRGAKVFAFAGIGRPEKFFAGLRSLGADICETRSFGDHAALSEPDAERILGTAHAQGLVIATTAKDLVRLGSGPFAQALAAQALRVDVQAELPDALIAAILSACEDRA
ncbi:MAG: tetraacyldisaccharide 4'-kinase [Pseudomonadota bacterium]